MQRIQKALWVVASSILLGCAYVQSMIPALRSATPTPSMDCTQLDLSTEECSNTGTHEYSSSTRILFDIDGQTCLTDDQNVVISFSFMDHDTLTYSNQTYDVEYELTRTADNQFEGGFVQADGEYEWKSSITFTQTGFVEEASSYYISQDEHLCTFLWTQEFVPAK